MTPTQKPIRTLLFALTLLTPLALPAVAQTDAQKTDPPKTDPQTEKPQKSDDTPKKDSEKNDVPFGKNGRYLSILSGFLGLGGYSFVGDSAKNALGDTKFYTSTSIFVRPKHYRYFNLTGGFQFSAASDHFFPFTGGNDYSLNGAAFRIDTPRKVGGFRPYFEAGLFAGRIRSVNLGFDRTEFTPAATIGGEYIFSRYGRIFADFHLVNSINGVNPSGFSFGVKLF